MRRPATLTAGRVGAGLLALLVGCTAAPPVMLAEHEPLAGVHVFVTRPIRVQPEPEPFLQGVVTAFVERAVLGGYHYTGTTWDPDDAEAMLEAQRRLNARFPGTVGIHVIFVEAPIVVGFGIAYRSIACEVYDPSGRLILRGDLSPPARRTLREMLLPARTPEVDGRTWGDGAWAESLAFVLPPRG